MIPALAIRGYGHGSGVWNPESTRFLVNIPKNASSFLLSWANRHGWLTGYALEFDTVEEVLIVLRDPVERWISGLCQYIRGFILNVHGPNGPVFPGQPITKNDYAMTADDFITQYTDVTERLIFDVISRFDDHTWPQWEILQGLPHCQHTWFYLDHNFEDRFSQYMGWPILNDLDYNRGNEHPDIDKLQHFFNQRLTARPELQNRVKEHYAKDYELISKVIQ